MQSPAMRYEDVQRLVNEARGGFGHNRFYTDGRARLNGRMTVSALVRRGLVETETGYVRATQKGKEVILRNMNHQEG